LLNLGIYQGQLLILLLDLGVHKEILSLVFDFDKDHPVLSDLLILLISRLGFVILVPVFLS
jgi:hypothetical protein